MILGRNVRSRMNVLLYSGPGTSVASVIHMRTTLRAFLSLSHDVILATPKMLREEPWQSSTSLLVFPGGRDVPFLEALSGVANDRIRKWVEAGGRYLGICAGAYYASSRISFQPGTPLEVVGERSLRFFPGACNGTAYPGFVYDSEVGARNIGLRLERTAWRDHWPQAPLRVPLYYNGGGAFFPDDGSESKYSVLARYGDLPEEPIAGVHCRVGHGSAILWAIHPEHSAPRPPAATDEATFKDAERQRKQLMRATLSMLGMDVPDQAMPVPAPKPQVLCGQSPQDLKALASKLEDIMDSNSIIEDINDRYRITFNDPSVDISDRFGSQPTIDAPADPSDQSTANGPAVKATRDLLIFSDSLPPMSVTPIFDLGLYFRTRGASSRAPAAAPLGSPVIYGEVVTSTQTLIDKNPKFLAALPTGLVSVASQQVSGRGRGGNSWLSPPGCLQFSLVLRMPQKFSPRVVFVQYLFGLAVVEAIRGVGFGYEGIGIRLKWPNDIYARTERSLHKQGFGLEGFQKIGGILVNSSYAGGDFTLVVGCGVNTTVPKPTTSVNQVIAEHNRSHGTSLAPLQPEELLGHIVNRFQDMWARFLIDGFEPFLDLYLDRWLHSDCIVKLEQTGETVRIVGITPDHGLLRTIPLQLDTRGQEVHGGPASGFVDLQPDSNSFDMLSGLLKVKR